MKIDEKELTLSRVEIVHRTYNANNQVVKEEWHYYYPSHESTAIHGFKPNKK
jgi:hypothetical protein